MALEKSEWFGVDPAPMENSCVSSSCLENGQWSEFTNYHWDTNSHYGIWDKMSSFPMQVPAQEVQSLHKSYWFQNRRWVISTAVHQDIPVEVGLRERRLVTVALCFQICKSRSVTGPVFLWEKVPASKGQQSVFSLRKTSLPPQQSRDWGVINTNGILYRTLSSLSQGLLFLHSFIRRLRITVSEPRSEEHGKPWLSPQKTQHPTEQTKPPVILTASSVSVPITCK